MAANETGGFLVQLLKIIESILNEIHFGDGAVQLDIDYSKIKKLPVGDRERLKVLQTCIAKFQSLQSQIKMECTTSDPPLKIAKTEQDDIDWSFVQVKSDKAEIDRRISAFIQQKQNEVDLVNKREFCNIVDSNQENQVCSCARTDAIFVPRFGQKSHIKVTRVGNTNTSDEAQALGNVTDVSRQSGRPKISCNETSVTERLHNIEHHLGFKPGGPVAVDIYEDIKRLENRILYLESLSPEYFNLQIPQTDSRSPYKPSTSSSFQKMSVDEIDKRISALKNSLQNKIKS